MSSETADGPVAARAQAEESMHAVGGAIMALNPFQEVRLAGLILGIDLGRSQSVFAGTIRPRKRRRLRGCRVGQASSVGG